MLLRTLEIEPSRLRRAVEATFARRSTPVPSIFPEGLSNAFAADPGKQAQWYAFTRNLSAPGPALGEVVTDLRASLSPVFKPEQAPSSAFDIALSEVDRVRRTRLERLESLAQRSEQRVDDLDLAQRRISL